MVATTIEERVSRLEGAYEHLATKGDLLALEAKMYRMGLLIVVANATVNGAFLAAIRWLG